MKSTKKDNKIGYFSMLINSIIHKTKNKEKEVPQLVKHVSTVNKNNPKEYINLSDSVESATVAQLVEYLPDEQESPQTSGFELFHENPGRGVCIVSINTKYKFEHENGI